MSCKGLQNDDNYNVVVKFPQSLGARCGATLTLFWRVMICMCGYERAQNFVFLCCVIPVLIIIFFGLLIGFVLLISILSIVACRFSPTLALEDLSIRNVTVYQSNVTIAAPDLPWQVNSRFNVTLRTRNRNRLEDCEQTFNRTMYVDVRYKDERILHQEIPLRFELKPSRSRLVVVELKGDHFPLKKELGPVMEAELRSGNFSLEFYFDTRYMRSPELKACRVVTKTECLVEHGTPGGYKNTIKSFPCFW